MAKKKAKKQARATITIGAPDKKGYDKKNGGKNGKTKKIPVKITFMAELESDEGGGGPIT